MIKKKKKKVTLTANAAVVKELKVAKAKKLIMSLNRSTKGPESKTTVQIDCLKNNHMIDHNILSNPCKYIASNGMGNISNHILCSLKIIYWLEFQSFYSSQHQSRILSCSCSIAVQLLQAPQLGHVT